MAKLILTFKGRELQSRFLDELPFSIGRDADNDMQIDSLAVAPHHVSLFADQEGIAIKSLDPDFPLNVNGVQSDEHHLQDGDCIGIGKHEIFFSNENVRVEKKQTSALSSGHRTEPKFFHSNPMVKEASLQVLRGKNIGLVIPLRRAMTRIGSEESGSAMIAHRKEGYFLSALASEGVKVNSVEVRDESIQLNHGDIVKVGPNTLQFFCET